MSKKRYRIHYDTWTALIEIEDNEKTLGHMRDQLLFYSGGQDLIDDASGDVVHAYIMQTAPALITESMDWKTSGVMNRFSLSSMYEGYIPLDGSFGVKLIHVDNWEFFTDDFYIKPVKEKSI